ncbi:MAG: hypothetical protein M5R38_14275 [Candidatus Methylomirabilis sp.]|nr:hypothetical protein [Candidatus Methylomirabilis sp.]
MGTILVCFERVDRINQSRISQAVRKLKDQLWILKDKTVGVWGLAFKPETDDVRYSPALALINRLLAEGAVVKAYDPKAMERVRRQLPTLTYCQDPYEAATGADALVVATEWKEFADLDLTPGERPDAATHTAGWAQSVRSTTDDGDGIRIPRDGTMKTVSSLKCQVSSWRDVRRRGIWQAMNSTLSTLRSGLSSCLAH